MQKEPIKISVQPDVIPTVPIEKEPAAVSPVPKAAVETVPKATVAAVPQEDIYENVQTISEQIAQQSVKAPEIETPQQVEEPQHQQQQQVDSEQIYQNQEDLAEYIVDTGIKATALYDYQAAADDEISFDPDDQITHIEQVRYTFSHQKNVNYLIFQTFSD